MLHQQQQNNMAFQHQQHNNDDYLKQTVVSRSNGQNLLQQDIDTSWIQPFIRLDHDYDDGNSFDGEEVSSFADGNSSAGGGGGGEKELGLMEIFASKFGGEGDSMTSGGGNSMAGEEDYEVDMDFYSFRMQNYNSGKSDHDSFSTMGMNDARLTDDFEQEQEQEEQEEEDRLEVYDGTEDHSVASLNQAFEKLTSCMERTSQTREMIRLAGLTPNAAAAPPSAATMTTTLPNAAATRTTSLPPNAAAPRTNSLPPNAAATMTTFQHSTSAPNLFQLQGAAPPRKSRSSNMDLLDSRSNHSTESGFRPRKSRSSNKLLDLLDSRSSHSTESEFRSRASSDSVTSLSSLGSKTKRSGGGIAKGRRRMKKSSNASFGGGGGVVAAAAAPAAGGVGGSVIGGPGLMKRSVPVSSSGPLPKNVRLSMSTRKQLLKDLRSKKNKSSSSSLINNRSSSSLPLFTVR